MTSLWIWEYFIYMLKITWTWLIEKPRGHQLVFQSCFELLGYLNVHYDSTHPCAWYIRSKHGRFPTTWILTGRLLVGYWTTSQVCCYTIVVPTWKVCILLWSGHFTVIAFTFGLCPSSTWTAGSFPTPWQQLQGSMCAFGKWLQMTFLQLCKNTRLHTFVVLQLWWAQCHLPFNLTSKLTSLQKHPHDSTCVFSGILAII